MSVYTHHSWFGRCLMHLDNHLFTFVVMGLRDVCGCVFGVCVQLALEWSTLEVLPYYLVGR